MEKRTQRTPVLSPPFKRVVHTRYADFEKRTERNLLKRKLERLLSEVDAGSTTFTLQDGEHPPVTIRLTHLWVAGSFARGAALCGDLDLIYDYEIVSGNRGYLPSERKIASTVFSALPLVRLYQGTPGHASMERLFQDAVLLWSGAGSDWRKALGAIVNDPNVGAHPRKLSVLPFRTEQLDLNRSGLHSLEDLVDARDEGLVDWEFLPFEEAHYQAIDDHLTQAEALDSVKRCMALASSASQRLTPLLLRVVDFIQPGAKHILHSFDKFTFRLGTTRFCYGRVGASLTDLYTHLVVDQMVLIPAPSTRGPNGAWVIHRGKNHPLNRFLSQLSCWVYLPTVAGQARRPPTARACGGEPTLQIFRSHDEAVGSPLSCTGFPTRVNGLELVKLLGGVQSVKIDGTSQHWHDYELTLSSREPHHKHLGWTFLQSLTAVGQPEAIAALRGKVNDLNGRAGRKQVEEMMAEAQKVS